MTIKYLDSKRIVKLSTDATETTNGTASSGTAVVFDASSEVGSGDGINYTGNVIGVNSGANVSPNYWDVAITATAKLKIPSSGVSEMSVTATMSNGGWSKFGLSSTQTDTTTADQGGLCSYGMTIADDGRAWYWDSTSLGGLTQFTGGAATYKITVDSSGVVKFYKDSSVIHTSSNTASGNYYIMAVPYQYNGSSTYTYTYSGDYVEITTGVKPTNVQDNSILVDKDTGKRFWFTKGTVVTEETLDSTNGTTSWNVSNGGSDITIDTGNNEIDITGTGQKSGYYDLGASVSASAWVLRFKITSSGVQSSNPLFWVGLFDTDTIVSNSTNVDGISLMMYSGGNYKLSMKNGHTMDSGGSQTDMSPTVSADTTTRYVEIVRDGSNAILTFYDSDTYTTSIGTCTVAITGTSFQYLCAVSYSQGSGRTYSLSDVKFYNGVSSVTLTAWTGNFDLTGLKASYNFDSISGGLVNQATTGDGLGSSVNGTVVGATLDTTNEKLGTGCYYSDGSDSTDPKVTIPSISVFSGATNPYTMSFWLKGDFDYTGSDNRVVWDFSGSNQVQLGKHPTNNWVLNFNSGSDLTLTGGATAVPNDNDWHHICMTRNSSSLYTVYVDSVSKGSVTNTLNVGGGSALNFCLFGYDDYNSEYWKGWMDEMGIWQRVLTTSEISTLYNSGKGKIIY